MKQRNIRLITQYALVQHTPICSEKCNDGSNLIPRSRYDLQFTIETLFIVTIIVYNGLLVLPNVRLLGADVSIQQYNTKY